MTVKKFHEMGGMVQHVVYMLALPRYVLYDMYDGIESACGLVDKSARAAYSLHSFRIYLACALYAAGCPNDRICAILRWRSEEALAIYARMNDPERTAWVAKAMSQKVDSTSAAHLPQIDPDDYVAALQAAIQTGELGRAARDADAGEVDEDELADAVREDDSTRARDTARQAARAITLVLEAQRDAVAGAPVAMAAAAPVAAAPMAADAATPARTRSRGGLAALARTLSPGT